MSATNGNWFNRISHRVTSFDSMPPSRMRFRTERCFHSNECANETLPSLERQRDETSMERHPFRMCVAICRLQRKHESVTHFDFTTQNENRWVCKFCILRPKNWCQELSGWKSWPWSDCVTLWISNSNCFRAPVRTAGRPIVALYQSKSHEKWKQ